MSREHYKSSPIIIITFVILIIAIISFIVYYLLASKNTKKSQPEVITITDDLIMTSAPTPNPSTTVDPKTKDWKTYKINDLGISFKYPKEWGEVSLQTGTVSANIGSGKSGRITFSDPSAKDLIAGYVSPDFSVGREGNDYELGAIWGAYKAKNCADLKQIKELYHDITGCQFVKAKNGKQGVIYNNLEFEFIRVTSGYYFTGRDDFPLFGIEYLGDKNNNSYLETFKSVIESIE
ncbi:MAG: hypothetical protein M1338_00520 [Patescibacteria group bacterium]|nr:hypothetical protein [Patescibacteria group bacterium]